MSLLAFDMAGEDAGQILGTAMAIKMVVYVSVARIASALAGLILLVTSWQALFSGTVIGFVASALLVGAFGFSFCRHTVARSRQDGTLAQA